MFDLIFRSQAESSGKDKMDVHASKRYVYKSRRLNRMYENGITTPFIFHRK